MPKCHLRTVIKQARHDKIGPTFNIFPKFGIQNRLCTSHFGLRTLQDDTKSHRSHSGPIAIRARRNSVTKQNKTQHNFDLFFFNENKNSNGVPRDKPTFRQREVCVTRVGLFFSANVTRIGLGIYPSRNNKIKISFI